MLDEFLTLVEEVFEKRFFDMPAGQIIGGALIIIAFLAVRRIFANTVIFYLTKFTDSTATELDGAFLDALKGPLKFIPIERLAALPAFQPHPKSRTHTPRSPTPRSPAPG